jgi:hypothetical protein
LIHYTSFTSTRDTYKKIKKEPIINPERQAKKKLMKMYGIKTGKRFRKILHEGKLNAKKEKQEENIRESIR